MDNLKICSNASCKQDNPQPLTNFYLRKTRSNRPMSRCKECQSYRSSDKPGNRKAVKKYRNSEKGSSKRRSKHIERTFGITLDQYNQMFDEQNGCCAICNKSETAVDYRTKQIITLAIDHNHETGKIRGLLCRSCNISLGYIKENFDAALNMAKYIQKDQGII